MSVLCFVTFVAARLHDAMFVLSLKEHTVWVECTGAIANQVSASSLTSRNHTKARKATQLAPPPWPASPESAFVAVPPVVPVAAPPSSSRPITLSNWLHNASTDENSLPI